MRTALKSLKEDRSVMILPADKGRASVLLDADNYHNKMTSLIESGPYRTVNKDPTDRLCRKLTDKLLVLKRNGSLDEKTYRKLRPQHKQPPRIYGLPKIHKPNIPLRPIVSCVNSFAYDLSAYLSDLLSPLTGLTSHTVPNSASFVQEVRSLSIHADETMVSFDVESLFTNVPIEGALNAALQRLSTDTSLPARTSLSPSQVTDLLGFVLRATYFSYNGSFYEQQEGAAMGSPVSAVIANLYMEVFEEQALQSCDPELRPRVWKRYVDDTFVISTRASVDGLLVHLNNQQPTIRFTMEAEKDGKIAFLDTLVHRESDGRLTTTVYRKATHTDQYLAYDSYHPQSVKRGVVKCLYDRAHRIVTKPNGKVSEKQHLASALVSNGYPLPFLQKVTKTRPRAQKEQANHRALAVLPYVERVSQTLRRCLEQHGIRTVFKSDTTLRNHLVRPKDPVPPGRRDGVVYRIPCGECDAVYIGETGRPVQERMKEHERDVRLARCQTSAVAEHANATGHGPSWNDVKFIDRDPHWHTRRVKEAIQIRLHPNNINRDNGIEIPEAWMPTIRKHSWERSDVGTANHRATRSPNHNPAGAI